jgi:hypothetical protein
VGPGWSRLPLDQRTALRAVVAAGLLVALVALTARSCAPQWSSRTGMERYIRMGPRGGAAELERALSAAFPPGSDVGQLFARLERMGFDCGPAVDPNRRGACRYRAGREDGRIVTAQVEVAHDGIRVGAIAVRMALSS